MPCGPCTRLIELLNRDVRALNEARRRGEIKGERYIDQFFCPQRLAWVDYPLPRMVEDRCRSARENEQDAIRCDELCVKIWRFITCGDSTYCTLEASPLPSDVAHELQSASEMHQLYRTCGARWRVTHMEKPDQVVFPWDGTFPKVHMIEHPVLGAQATRRRIAREQVTWRLAQLDGWRVGGVMLHADLLHVIGGFFSAGITWHNARRAKPTRKRKRAATQSSDDESTAVRAGHGSVQLAGADRASAPRRTVLYEAKGR